MSKIISYKNASDNSDLLKTKVNNSICTSICTFIYGNYGCEIDYLLENMFLKYKTVKILCRKEYTIRDINLQIGHKQNLKMPRYEENYEGMEYEVGARVKFLNTNIKHENKKKVVSDYFPADLNNFDFIYNSTDKEEISFIVLKKFHLLDKETSNKIIDEIINQNEYMYPKFVICSLTEFKKEKSREFEEKINVINANHWKSDDIRNYFKDKDKVYGSYDETLINSLIKITHNDLYLIKNIIGSGRELVDRSNIIDSVDKFLKTKTSQYIEIIHEFSKLSLTSKFQTQKNLIVFINSKKLNGTLEELYNGIDIDEFITYLHVEIFKNEKINVIKSAVKNSINHFKDQQINKMEMDFIIFDYDKIENKINIVDKTFLNWLCYLENTTLEELVLN